MCSALGSTPGNRCRHRAWDKPDFAVRRTGIEHGLTFFLRQPIWYDQADLGLVVEFAFKRIAEQDFRANRTLGYSIRPPGESTISELITRKSTEYSLGIDPPISVCD